jgi:glucuronokinase
MDRVIQAYEQTMVLDFSDQTRPRDESCYTVFADPLPPMLVAWVPAGGRSSGITHSDLKERWQRGDDDVTRAMRSIAAGVDRAIRALRANDLVAFADAVDANFDLRCSVTDVTAEDREMVEIARVAGAAAKLCGSGGAVLVVPRPGATMEGVASALEDAGYATCRPELVG